MYLSYFSISLQTCRYNFPIEIATNRNGELKIHSVTTHFKFDTWSCLILKSDRQLCLSLSKRRCKIKPRRFSRKRSNAAVRSIAIPRENIIRIVNHHQTDFIQLSTFVPQINCFQHVEQSGKEWNHNCRPFGQSSASNFSQSSSDHYSWYELGQSSCR